MRTHFIGITRARICLLMLIIVAAMMTEVVYAGPQYYQPKKAKSDSPSWLEIFAEKSSPKQTMYKSGSSNSVRPGAISTTSRGSGSLSAPSFSPFQNALLNKPSISVSVGSSSWSNSSAGVSVPMRIRESNKTVIHVGASSSAEGGMAVSAGGQRASRSNSAAGGAAGVSVPSMTYAPFVNDAPSSYCDDETDATYAMRVAGRSGSGPRRVFPGRPDDIPSPTSPVGEPWILLILAMAFGGVIWMKKRKYTKT